jgi:DNA-binding NarL/FixJ family response regulator
MSFEAKCFPRHRREPVRLCTPALRTPAGLKLSGRLRDVIELVVAGLSDRQIAKSREELASIIRSEPVGGSS